MNKTSVFLKNLTTVILLALALIIIYLFASGNFASNNNMPNDSDNNPTVGANDSNSEPAKENLSELGAFLASLEKSSSEHITLETFDKSNMKLTLADISNLELKRDFSLSKKSVKVPERIPDEIFGTYTTQINETEAERAQIELYDGLIIVDRGDKLELYLPDGTEINDNFALSPIYRRDKNGKALYFDGNNYYTLENNEFTVSDYSSADDTRILDYENTPDYACDNNGLFFEKDAESGLFAVLNSDGEMLTEYAFTKIYAYSEALAAGVNEDGHLVYIDTDGNTVFGEVISYRNTSDRYVDRIYAAPDTMGEESVGFLYFDGGLVLAREKIVDYVYKENTISDQTTVLKSDGSKLELPSDYNPISSADGVVVAEKDGFYGVFSASGKWVIHPKYENIAPYHEGLAVVAMDGKYGVYDTDGNEIIPIMFDYISPVSGGLICAYSEEFGFTLFTKQLITA